MMRWVVTGPAGAGKSAFTAYLGGQGAVILDADKLGHEVLERPEIQAAVRENFGAQMIQAGKVDRRELGRMVFGDPQAMLRLNRITHPSLEVLAGQRLAEAATGSKAPLAVLEAAVYFLWPNPPVVDLVVAVVASEVVRRHRLGECGLAPADVEARIKAQRNMDHLWAEAQEVIVNEGSLADLTAVADRLLARHLGSNGVG